MWRHPAAVALVSVGGAVVLASRAYSKLLDAPRPPPSQRFSPGREPQAGPDSVISVIIPAYNEGPGIAHTLSALAAATERQHVVEVILVDGGCVDETMAQAAAVRLPFPLRTAKATGGRGPALAAGAAAARGDLLLFLHADTLLPQGYDVVLRSAFTDPALLLSAFKFRVDRASVRGPRPPRGLGILEWFVDRRTRRGLFPYGDQALCISAANYTRLGGFPPFPLMEDFEFVRRAKGVALECGWRIAQLPLAARCAARRWEARGGVLPVTITNSLCVIRYVALGWSPQRLFEYYYGRPPVAPN